MKRVLSRLKLLGIVCLLFTSQKIFGGNDLSIGSKSYVPLITITVIILLLVIIFLLIRSKRKTEELLLTQNEELKKENEAKNKFFSIIAHDLKSPFNSLLGFSEMLLLQAESHNYNDVIKSSKTVYSSTKKLFNLVETLLQWSRTQIGATEYKPQATDVKLLCDNIVSVLKMSAEEKDIVVAIKSSNTMSAWADQDLFSSVLRNLISNAIKFSQIGSSVFVEIKENNDFIEITVRDTGVGIKEEMLTTIFEIDHAKSTRGTLNEQGTGLGLILCKEFVEINKGNISISSELNKGSIVTFTVPIYKK